MEKIPVSSPPHSNWGEGGEGGRGQWRGGGGGGAACLEKWVLERAVLDMINAVLPTSVIVFFAYLYSGIKQDAKKYF